MAKAQGIPSTIHVPMWEPYVTLTLSKEEAQALYDISGAIGGDTRKSPRQYFSDNPESFRTILGPFVRKQRETTHSGTVYFEKD